MAYLSYLFFRVVVALFWLVPFRLMYAFSDLLAWLFFRVFKYRYAVVMSNLRNSFPNKSAAEIHAIAWASYRNLADILLEGIKAFAVSPQELYRRYKIVNPELVNDCTLGGGNSFAMAAHMSNWEWGTVTLPMYLERRVVAVFKPLHNRYINEYIIRQRRQTGLYLYSMKQTAAAFSENTATPCVFVFIADQSPSSQRSQWVTFLGQDTACLHGADVYARETNFPVFYYHSYRVRRGFYELRCEMLAEQPAELAETEVTQRYMQRLEAILLDNPNDWLWSHKRWKHRRDTPTTTH